MLIGLPGLLREFEEYRLLIYGGALVAIMILRPQGLIPNVRRSRELADEEVTQDAWASEGGGRVRGRGGGAAGRQPRGGAGGPRVSAPQHLLELTDVAKHFGGLYALSGLTFHVDPGEIVSVIGPNGAGKSTMFNVVTGLYEPDDGGIRFRGDNVVGLAPEPDHQARHRPDVPDGAPVPQHDDPGERDGRPALPDQVRRRRLHVPPPRHPARGGADPCSGAREPGVLRLPSRRLPGRPARLRALVREPAAARDGEGARDGPSARDARRAHGRA